MKNIHQYKILILDFGSQYTQLIARRIREIGVFCEMMHYDVSESMIKNFAPDGVILSGGPESVTEPQTPRIPNVVFHLGCPILGICYGMQAMAQQLGGQVESAKHREYGYAELNFFENSPLFQNIFQNNETSSLSTVRDASLLSSGVYKKVNEQRKKTCNKVMRQNTKFRLDVWMSHGDQVTELPKNFKTIAYTHTCPIAAMADESKKFYGVQFHPEVTHTHQGLEILKNFVFNICQCKALWTPQEIISDSITKIKRQVKNDSVILGLSGGVDSSVLAVLLHQAIGNQLTCVFVDTGLLRLHEAEQIRETFAKHFDIRLISVDAKQQFYQTLQGIFDPELKRKTIGSLFIEIFSQECQKIKNAKWLAQGTIYPDVIESAGAQSQQTAHVIKSHHNVGGLPENLPFQLLEPLRELFKDEVRKIGHQLGLPDFIINRHPFPGPGLAVRILGEIKPEYVSILQQADAIFMEELHNNDYYDKVSQAFAVFLPVKSVGVMGDARKYDYVICLRAVNTIDFMTAKWSHLPYSLLEKIANRIINEVPGISRVTYDISSKPPATIEWE
ncbi:MAG: glutamine-hydrolyzing GMP synthase [Gammaproteobacteria bacterium]|nr:glutamine-hydrolyzing GMP synthase [Gammaproteobacteria bacterium]